MADALTCLHHIIGPAFDKMTDTVLVACMSCATDVSKSSMLKGRLYEYDIDHNVWVYQRRR
jgi:hypothetical protein